MTSLTAELLIEQSEAVKMDIRNLEDAIREIPFDRTEQILALRDLHTAFSNLEQQLHRAIALFE